MSDTITVKVGGEDLTIFRPKGRAGRAFIVKVHGAIEVISPVVDLRTSEDSKAINTIVAASNALYNTEELGFETELLPGLYRHSRQHCDESDQWIMDRLDQIEDPPLQLAQTFMEVMSFWAGMSEGDKEALEEAQKK